MTRRHITIGLGVGALLFAILSARLYMPYLAYGVVACTIATMLLCVWSKLDSKATPYLVFLLGLALLYQSSLISNGLVGTDIHTEYYFYQAALDGWDWTLPHVYNAAIGSTIIAPFLTNWFGIPGYWVFKAIFPALFALVPLMLFVIYRKEFGEKVAFLGCVFFVTLPTYTIEMIGLPRQMLGEIMLAVVLLLVIVRPIRLQYSIPLLIITASLGYLFHWITGPAILMYTAGCALVLAFMKTRQFSLKWLTPIIVISALIGFAYYGSVADGTPLKSLTYSSARLGERIAGLLPLPEEIPISEPEPFFPYLDLDPSIVELEEPKTYFHTQEPLMRTALGLDFMDASVPGKGFRIFQFGTQLALVLGCVWLLLNRKKISAEYVAFTLTAVGLVAACVLLPRFSNIINLSRFYHLALFLLSPLVVMGGLYFARNLKTLVLVLLIPYMLFTTGAVFELTKETEISKVNIPYSIALSSWRVPIVGIATDNDLAVRDWIVETNRKLVVADRYGMLLLSEFLDYTEGISIYHWDSESLVRQDPTTGWGLIPRDISYLPGGAYIFLTEYNTRTQTLVFVPNWFSPLDTAAGMRQTYSLDFVGISDNVEVAHQIGRAMILRTG